MSKKSLISRTILILSVFMMLLSLSLAAQADRHEAVSDLWIDLSLGPPLVAPFNQRALPMDIARVENVSQLDLLGEISAGQKLVVFKSVTDAERLLPHIHDDIDIVGYNLEHGPNNPRSEQEQPVESMRRMRELADEYDLKVALGPDRSFAISDGAAMARYADIMVLQVQKVQTEPETVYDFVRPLIRDFRATNPDIEISVQIRTEGEIDDLLALLEPLHDELDGISILTSVETVPVAQSLLQTLRPQIRVTPTPQLGENTLPVVRGDDGVAALIASSNSQSDAALQDGAAPNAVLESRASLSAESVPGRSGGLSTAEANQRLGIVGLLLFTGAVVVLALGAGYLGRRSNPT